MTNEEAAKILRAVAMCVSPPARAQIFSTSTAILSETGAAEIGSPASGLTNEEIAAQLQPLVWHAKNRVTQTLLSEIHRAIVGTSPGTAEEILAALESVSRKRYSLK